MVDHSAWRLELARAYIAPYAERAQIAVLGGSVAQGVADRWSDIDTIVYWDDDRPGLARDAARRGRTASGSRGSSTTPATRASSSTASAPSRPTSRTCGSAGSTS